VSKALLISGMFMPKLGLVPVLGAAFDAALVGAGLVGADAGAATGGVAAAKAVVSAGVAAALWAVLGVLLAVLLAVLLEGAVSVARSHDPISWERATEKNRST
jgi:hypothetical protein